MQTDKRTEQGYYGRYAYNPENLPRQKRPDIGPNSALPWFNQKVDRKLPWGSTQDVAPQSYRTDYSPDTLRRFESEPNRFENLDFHQRIDHERYRHATAALRTRILLFINAFGHPFIIAFMVLPVLVGLAAHLSYSPSNEPLSKSLLDFLPVLAVFMGPLVACNLIPTMLFRLFPNWLIKPDKGPRWEFNRRTGLVTVYHYDRKGKWGKTGQPEEEIAPFYEFDAGITSEVIYPGGQVHTLYLANRYHPIVIPVGNLIGKSSPEECYALWDMLQNFMDTSRPLPDIPLWEEFRPNDPVTAEHDRQTSRPPRYWRNMDKDTWKKKNEEMGLEVLRLATTSRPDIMKQSWTDQPRSRKPKAVPQSTNADLRQC